MSFEKYRELIEKTNNPNKLLELKRVIEHDQSLSDGDKRVLISIHLVPKLESMAKEKDIDLTIAESKLEELRSIVDEELFDFLEGFLLVWAPEHYSRETFKKRVLNYIPSLIKHVYSMRRRPIGLQDLHRENLRDDHIRRFIKSKTATDSGFYLIANYLNTFGRWLEERKKGFEFTKIEAKKPKRKSLPTFLIEEMKEKGGEIPVDYYEDRKGIPRRSNELSQIISAWDYASDSSEPPRNEQLKIYIRLLLQTGLRPEHALSLNVSDFDDKKVYRIEDVWGRSFVMIRIRDALERERKRIGYKITEIKQVPEVVFVSESLQKRIITMKEEYDLPEDMLVCNVPHSTQKDKMMRVRRMTGIRFRRYDLRETWASVVYNASGYDLKLVKDLGGWETSNIPLEVYITTMSPEEAVKIAKNFEIFLPKTTKKAIESIEKGAVYQLEKIAEEWKSFKDLLTKMFGGRIEYEKQ